MTSEAIPTWALLELQEDLQDAAVDLGIELMCDPKSSALRRAEDMFALASEKLRRALELVGAQ